MSNKSRKIVGIIFLIVLIVVGFIVQSKNHGSAGWTLVLLGGLGLFGVAVDWVHNQFKKPNGE